MKKGALIASSREDLKYGSRQKGEEEEKGVVRLRPTGVTVSAIMQLFKVFGLGESGSGRRGLAVGRGLTVSQHCAVRQDGGGELQRRGGRP